MKPDPSLTVASQHQINWLMAGDPAIRYQVLRDLLDAGEKDIKAERQKIFREGWGKRFLDLQDPGGTWGNGLYSPKWTSTFYTLLTLMRLGMPPTLSVQGACRLVLDKGFSQKDKGINLFKTIQHSDTCVTGMFLSFACHFEIHDPRLPHLIEHLLEVQMKDGGWNCDWHRGATHSSFHSTLSVLEGLWAYSHTANACCKDSIFKARREGIDFLLQHHLFRSHRTGAIVDPRMLRFSFPPRWRYDIMRCLDHFRAAGVPRDVRMQDAIDVLLSKRTGEGLWKLQNKHAGRVFFDMEKTGQSSRMNTLRAFRILNWWQSSEN